MVHLWLKYKNKVNQTNDYNNNQVSAIWIKLRHKILSWIV